MMMTPRVRKLVLAVHLTLSGGWIGAVVAYVALGVAASASPEPSTVRAAWVAMELTGWYVVVPLALGSLLTGLLMGLGTKWGLVRYYWVLITLALTTVAVIVLVLHMPTVSTQAAIARSASGTELQSLGGDLFHSVLGLMVLLTIQVLNIFKPSGMTRFGWRRQQQIRGRNLDLGR